MSTAHSQDLVRILRSPSHATRKNSLKTSPRRETFVRRFLETGNATKSAISAGYSPKSAAAAGSRLLKNDEIKAAIDAELLRRAEMSGITDTYVLEGIRAIAENPDAKDADKLRAYELLGKHLRLWTQL